jgi:hypothetical protein
MRRRGPAAAERPLARHPVRRMLGAAGERETRDELHLRRCPGAEIAEDRGARLAPGANRGAGQRRTRPGQEYDARQTARREDRAPQPPARAGRSVRLIRRPAAAGRPCPLQMQRTRSKPALPAERTGRNPRRASLPCFTSARVAPLVSLLFVALDRGRLCRFRQHVDIKQVTNLPEIFYAPLVGRGGLQIA